MTVVSPPSAGAADHSVLVGTDGTLGNSSGTLTIDVAVEDATGKLVTAGLSVSNFSFRNVTLQRSPSGAPVSDDCGTDGHLRSACQPGERRLAAVLVFDCSGSMDSPHEGYPPSDPDGSGRGAGGNAFIDLLQPGDQAAIMEFSSFVWRAQDFTSNKDLLRQAISSFSDYGGTALWDAAMDALRRLQVHASRGGAVVLLTDGAGTDSTGTPDGVIAQAQTQGTAVFAVGLGNQPQLSELRRVTTSTGGPFLEAANAGELESVFAGFGKERRLATSRSVAPSRIPLSREAGIRSREIWWSRRERRSSCRRSG